MRRDVRFHAWATATLLTLLAGCGLEGPDAMSDAASATVSSDQSGDVPEIRALMPADLDADGLPDAIPHSDLRRLLIQAPAGTRFTVSDDSGDRPFRAREIVLADGTQVHEIELEGPLGGEPITVAADEYMLQLLPDARLGEREKLNVHPDTPGAVASDFAAPRGVLYPGEDDVAFTLGGAVPSLESGLFLQCGAGRTIELTLAVASAGLVAQPATTPEPGVVYTLRTGPEASGPYAEGDGYSAPEVDFRLMCRGSGGEHPIRVARADLNRDGDQELLTLFADGAVTALVDPDYSTDVVIQPGDAALDFASGDLDGNGATDLVLLTGSGKDLELLYLLNQTRHGESSFTVRRQSLELEAPLRVACADFNRDGRDDVAVLGAFGEVLLRSSGHDPVLVTALPERALASDLVLSDVDGDGKPDLVVLAADGTVQVTFNRNGHFNGDTRTFDAPGALQFGTGELDGDRFADFILSGNDERLSLALGGGLPRVDDVAVRGTEQARLAAALLCRDINGDSRDDILVALEDRDGMCEEIAVYLNSRSPGGDPDAVLPLGTRVRVYALEFWKDHIVMAASEGLLVLRVNPAVMPPSVESDVRFVRGYAPMPQIPAPLASAIADFNDDGRSDVAVLDRDGELQIWLSGAEGEPFAPSADPIPLGSDGTLQAIDFDRDSAPDLLYIPNDRSQRPRMLRNNRDGTFGDDDGMLPSPPSILRGAPALGDFDRDGDLDVFWPSPLGRLQFNDGRSGWRDSRASLEVRDEDGMRLEFSGELACADFTGDGFDDVAAVMQLFGDESAQRIVLLEGTGADNDVDSPFRITLTHEINGRLFGLTPVDIDGNGRLGLAVGFGPDDEAPRLTMLRLGLDGQFRPFDGAPEARGRLLDIALDDLDRDGDLDLVVSEDVPDAGPQLTLWVNDGGGRFGEAGEAQRSLLNSVGAFQATNLSFADFTGNGRPDLLAIDRDGNVVIVRTSLP